MSAFDYTDYHAYKDEKWINYDDEHKPIRERLNQIKPDHYGLLIDDKTNQYIMTLTRNPDNLTRDWKTELSTQNFQWVGEAFCGALLVYFRDKEESHEN